MRFHTLILLLTLGAAQPLAGQPPWVTDPDLFKAPEDSAEQPASAPVGSGPVPAGSVTLEALAAEGQALDELEAELQALEAALVRSQAGGPAAAEPDQPPASGNEPWSRRSQEQEAFEELRDTGRAPVLARPTGTVYPYGETVPTLVCAPDRACDLALEAGEVIDGLALGAADQWEVTRFFEGTGEELVPHVIVKPHQFGARTNLVVVTSRRTYHLELRSIEEAFEEDTHDEAPAYHHQVAFWYPEQWARSLRSPEEREAASEAAEAGAPRAASGDTAPDPARLHFRYRVEPAAKKRQRLPWVPRAVYDDGARIYIQLPPGTQPLPALVGVGPDGNPFPVNETLEGDTFVVPRLVEHLELTHGTAKARRYLQIHRLARQGEAR